MDDRTLKALEERYTVEPGWVPGVRSGRHDNAARAALGEVYRHRLGNEGTYPEIGMVEVQRAQSELASALSECDEYKSAMADVLVLVKEVRRLQKAMRTAMADMPSDESRGYETLSLALGEP